MALLWLWPPHRSLGGWVQWVHCKRIGELVTSHQLTGGVTDAHTPHHLSDTRLWRTLRANGSDTLDFSPQFATPKALCAQSRHIRKRLASEVIITNHLPNRWSLKKTMSRKPRRI